MRIENWSRNVSFAPKTILSPTNEDEVRSAIEQARKTSSTLRVAGSMHSFTPLNQTQDIYINTDQLQGLISADAALKRARVQGGTKIRTLGKLLFDHQMAQENLGDIDSQSIAGATATGTHGTGLAFGGISTQIAAMTLINGRGEKVSCSETENSQIFKAAQLSLGLLGIVTEIELKTVSPYVLEFTSGKEHIDSILEHFDTYNEQHRNFEFYWFPYSAIAETKFSNTVFNHPPESHPLGKFMDNILENHLFSMISFPTRYLPFLAKPICKLCATFVSTSTKVDWSHQVYAMPRTVKFHEMEYNIPYECFRDVKKECIRAFRKHQFPTHFPTESRFGKADDIFLSPSYDRKSAYIAFHVYRGTEYKKYFKTMEDICLAYGGRPHWGKMHNQTARFFEKAYPKWSEFLAVRQQMDPDGVFLNDYLKEILF